MAIKCSETDREHVVTPAQAAVARACLLGLLAPRRARRGARRCAALPYVIRAAAVAHDWDCTFRGAPAEGSNPGTSRLSRRGGSSRPWRGAWRRRLAAAVARASVRDAQPASATARLVLGWVGFPFELRPCSSPLVCHEVGRYKPQFFNPQT